MKRKILILLSFFLLFSVLSSATWYDPSYEYRHNITQTNTSHDLLGPLNGTSPINENYDNQNHWIYGTWRGNNSEYLDIYHQDTSGGGWNQTLITNNTTEYCVIQTLPTNYTSCPKTPKGLISYYPLDENGSKAWDHIGQNHGNLSGGITQGTNGEIGNAYSFNGGTSGVDVSSLAPLNEPFTISLWAKKDSTTTYKRAFDYDQNFIHIGYEVRGSKGYEFNVYDGTHHTITSGNTKTGTWLHLVGRSDKSGKMEFFINGNSQGTATHGDITDEDKIGIGWDAQNNKSHWDGDIDDVRIYNRSLSKSEIKALYHNKASLGKEESNTDDSSIDSDTFTVQDSDDTNLEPSSSELAIKIEDSTDKTYNITYYNESDDTKIKKIENVKDGTHSIKWNSTKPDQTYKWYAKITDGENTSTTETYNFTTIDIDLSWTDNSNNENGFKIYSNASGTYKQITNTNKKHTSTHRRQQRPKIRQTNLLQSHSIQQIRRKQTHKSMHNTLVL